MKNVALALVAVLLVASVAEAGIRNRGQCSTGGCSTSSGCTVNNNQPDRVPDLTIVPITRPVQPTVAVKGDKGDKGDPGMPGPAGPAGLAGAPGERGEAGKITDEQLAALQIAVVEHVVIELKPQLIAAIKADPAFRGPAGENGRDGNDGLPIDIKAVAIEVQKQMPAPDFDAIAKEVAVRLPPIRMVVAASGDVPLEQSARLGGTLTIPPVRLQQTDGKVVTKALGQQFAITAIELPE